jgi:peroxiredoxin
MNMLKTNQCAGRWSRHAMLLALSALFTFALSADEMMMGLKAADSAPDFSLKTLDDRTVTLAALKKEQPVVLVILRGWPGYQCPICSRQVQEFVASADAFAAQKAKVVMVYPGPAADLRAHAAEFLHDKNWPRDFVFLTDPDYTFTKAYHARWDAPHETAYPSTFVIDSAGKIRFAKISMTHGDRADVKSVIESLESLKKMDKM